jgi:hypothetical protein
MAFRRLEIVPQAQEASVNIFVNAGALSKLTV